MSHASKRGEAMNQLIKQLADQFDASGIEYTCGKVVIDWVREHVTTSQLEAIPGNWTAGRCAHRVWDEIHARWKAAQK